MYNTLFWLLYSRYRCKTLKNSFVTLFCTTKNDLVIAYLHYATESDVMKSIIVSETGCRLMVNSEIKFTHFKKQQHINRVE